MALQRMVMTVWVLLLVVCTMGWARMDVEALARTAQNPLADRVSLPLEDDAHHEVAGSKEVLNVLDVKLIYPFHRKNGWNVITHTALPVISQPSSLSGEGRKGGIGDLSFTAFFTRAQPSAGAWTWGVGPILTVPTGSPSSMATDQWGIGPAVAALRTRDRWVYGVMADHVVDFVGNADMPGINRTHIQPFVYYNFNDGLYVVSAPLVTANWENGSSDRWTIPVGAGVGRALQAGPVPLNVAAHYYRNIETTSLGANWTLRFQLQMFFPQHR